MSKKAEIMELLDKHGKFCRDNETTATEIEKVFIGETSWTVKIKEGWHQVGRKGKQVGREIFAEQWWTPVLWDDEEDPDFFKSAGLDKIEKWKTD